jgi:hypothetical protein
MDQSSAVPHAPSQLTKAVAQVTGKLFCGYHQGYADASTGANLVRNNKKIWMCAACMKLRKISVPNLV